MSGTGWLLVRWLHVLAMALFVGGQLVLVVAIVPVLRGDPQRERLRLVARRFGWASLVALAVLAATGSAMAAHESRWASGTLQVKLGLVAAVIGLIVWHMRRPGAHALEGLVFVISIAIVWLGLALAHGPLPFD